MFYQNENFGGEHVLRCGTHCGYECSVHIHEYSELFFCKSGTADAIINGKPMSIPQNHIVFIPPNQPHGYNCNEKSFVYCAVFSNDLVPLFFKQLKHKTIVPTCIDFSAYLDLAEALPRLNHASPILLSGYLNLICDVVLNASSYSSTTAKDSVLYQKVLSYISANYTENITLKSVAAKFGYSEKYLSSTLHTLTGINFRKLVSFYRVNHAKQLFQAKKHRTVAEIATECGFSSISNFNLVFKEITGVSPSQYVKGAPTDRTEL